MNNYNLVAEYISKKYISRISGENLKERIVGDEPIDYVMTGLLAEDRIEQSFEGKYVENLETKYQSIPSIGLKFDVKNEGKPTVTIFPKGLLFYTVKPQYEETVDYFLRLESGKSGETFSNIEQLADKYPDKKFYLPKVYKKVAIQDVVPEGIQVDIESIPADGIHLQNELVSRISAYIQKINDEIKIMHEDQITYADLLNEDLFSVVCTAKDLKVMPVWKFDFYVSAKKIARNINIFVQMVNRTEKLNGNNCGYLPQIFAAGFDVKGDKNIDFMPIELDYFKDNYKERKQCFSIAENSSSSYDKKTNTLSTVNVPVFYQYRTKTNDEYNSYIEFDKLIENPVENLEAIHKCMLQDLEKRQKEFQDCKESFSDNACEKFELALEEFEQEIKRFSFGIEQIKYKDMVYKAFVLMNKTFATKVDGDHRSYKGWRLFQIVFIVSLICEIIESEYVDDLSVKNATKVETANLLYFPTGGGKTEAFLGASVFTMFFDRLRGKNEGLTGILKYPLRLLAVQQLDRVLAVTMKANLVRETEKELKESHPFAVGFLIGSGNTPNKIYENDMFNTGSEAIIHGDQAALNENYRFVDTCPICGKKLVEVSFDQEDWRLKHICTNPECSAKVLPLMIIDNEIYRYLPSLVVSTVDKMAALGFSDEFKLLMGQVRFRCKKHGFAWKKQCSAKYNCEHGLNEIEKLKDPIPTLFIQDEMHLVKESLGTFDSHYEAFIKYYAENLVNEVDRKKIRFIGATATISMYEDHIKHLYHMRGRRFPCEYPSRNPNKDFYSYIDGDDITRIIMGFAPYGRSITRGIWEAVYNMRLQICEMMQQPEECYKSLCKLGFTGTEDELKDILYDYWIELVYNNRKEDVMNLDNAFMNQANDRLQDKGLPPFVSAQMTSDNNFQEVRKALFDIQSNRKNLGSVNLILATSTISHGVDEDSFNNMFFYGIPNTNAEYIQAYSRSGRKYTGLVVDVIRLLRVRDRAYLKNFVLFHENKDDLVESVPINRWAKNAIYNTLPGILNGLFLQYYAVMLGMDSLNKTNDVKKLLVGGDIDIADVIKNVIGIYGCVATEKMSINYEEIIKKEVFNILSSIKNGIFDNSDKFADSIKAVHSKHYSPMTSLRDTEEQIEVAIVER